jgi:hypothetical protein
MASFLVRLSPGFPLGGGFPVEQFLLRWYFILLCGNSNARQQMINTHMVLCMSLEYRSSKKNVFLRCSNT